MGTANTSAPAASIDTIEELNRPVQLDSFCMIECQLQYSRSKTAFAAETRTMFPKRNL
jgi:hypothetical protein